MLPNAKIFYPPLLGSVFVLGALSGLMSSAFAQSGIEPLGTLFYSPAERFSIERNRSSEGTAVINFGKSISLKGLVRRDAHKGTTWVNGQVVDEGQRIPKAGVPVISAKKITIDGKSLRVGETLDVESGARSDVVPENALVKRKM